MPEDAESKDAGSEAQWPRLVFDADNSNIAPRRFRMTSQTVEQYNQPDWKGFSQLNASASGQFSLEGLRYMKRAIGGGYRMTVVDLRQECHGFVNGTAISWFGEHNGANKGMSQEEVIRMERSLLDAMADSKLLTFETSCGIPDLSHSTGLIGGTGTVQSEEELAEAEGLGYARFCVTDHYRPNDAVVDGFIAFVKALPIGVWLHFHCRGGVGRASTFMLMYDMMRNAGQVAYADMLQRQQLVGGRDMYRMNPQDAYKYEAAVERLAFIGRFHDYCASCREDYSVSWTEWLGNSAAR